jgi:hypothetical protein
MFGEQLLLLLSFHAPFMRSLHATRVPTPHTSARSVRNKHRTMRMRTTGSMRHKHNQRISPHPNKNEAHARIKVGVRSHPRTGFEISGFLRGIFTRRERERKSSVRVSDHAPAARCCDGRHATAACDCVYDHIRIFFEAFQQRSCPEPENYKFAHDWYNYELY